MEERETMKLIRNILKPWLPRAVTIIAVFGGIYLTVQQSYRMGANDPQIQMTEDRPGTGKSPGSGNLAALG